MAQRRAISKRVRFEVFKRDSFTCQYCGKCAPDVILELDHIVPLAEGGDNEITNLVTSCHDCNAGKGARPLDDDSVIAKQREQLKQLSERREQLEMMLEWRQELSDQTDFELDSVCDYWHKLADPFRPNEHGQKQLRSCLRKYGLQETLSAMDASADQYIELGQDGQPTSASVDKAFNYIARICSTRRATEKKPYLQDLLYIRGILRNRLSYMNDRVALDLLEQAYRRGAAIDSLQDHAKRVHSWSEWRDAIEDFIEEHEHTDEHDE